jgi:ribosomal protein S18 acetylase RimI-like enzyme
MTPDLRQITVQALEPAHWETLAGIRLRALKDSPRAFAARLDEEGAWVEREWRRAFAHRIWFVAWTDAEPHPIGLARMYAKPGHRRERHIESMWVDPRYRRRKVATAMVDEILRQACLDPFVRAISLRILDGNELARTVYERLGFSSTGETNPLWVGELRVEERLMRLL